MKIIVAGATGFIGGEVLAQCLNSPAVSSLIALSRRELPSSLTRNSPKLKVVLLKEFTSYPDEALDELAGAEACIWALGKAVGDLQTTRRINLDYTLAATETFATKLASQVAKGGSDKRFTFVYCSGFLAEKDQNKTLWFMQDARRMRGEVENRLIEVAAREQHRATFDTLIVRPAVVLPKEGGTKTAILGLAPSVNVEELAAVMVDAAVNGSKRQILENEMLKSQGRALLRRSS